MNRKLLCCALAFAWIAGCGGGSNNNHNTTPASITATTGSGQSVSISTAFASPLAATVLNSSGSPVSGVTVTFAAPSAGASGSFAGGANTATTNASGVATSAVFTANTTAGAYSVTASVSGVSTPASFSLTNNAGTAAAINATSGSGQIATFNSTFAAPLAAVVKDAGGNPVPGATVTFTAPSSGASGTFAGGANTATTDATGTATSPAFTANVSVGVYTVTATVAGVTNPANFSLTNNGVNFVFNLNGQEITNAGANFYALAGVITVDGNGNVLLGEQDFNDGITNTSPQPSGDTIASGSLTADPTTGQGTLTLVTNNTALGESGTETLGIQFVNTKHALIIGFDGVSTSSGSLDQQTLGNALSGSYAFTISGVDGSYSPIAGGGVFSISGTALQNGVIDVDDAGTVTTGTAWTGSIGTPDAFGRGAITGLSNATSINYYVVGPETFRIIDVDTTDSFIGSAYGQGTAAGSFSSASLGTSVTGFTSNGDRQGYVFTGAGMFTTTPSSGAFQGVTDSDAEGQVESAEAVSGTYTIASNGYGNLQVTTGGLAGITNVGVYATDPNLNLTDPNNTSSGVGGALVVLLSSETSPPVNGTGFVLPQTDNSPASFAGNYAFGGQDYWGCGGICEFDFVAQAALSSGALTGTGLLSDPDKHFGPDTTDPGTTFSGTATPDPNNVGRYTLPLAITPSGGTASNLTTVLYQANGGQLLWVDEDVYALALGLFEQQAPSLAGLPASAPAVKAKVNHKQ